MAWRLRWVSEGQEERYAMMGERVSLWTDATGALSLERGPEGWEWAALVDDGLEGPRLVWRHAPEGVVLYRGDKVATPEALDEETVHWEVQAGDRVVFEGADVTLEIVATSFGGQRELEVVSLSRAETPGESEAKRSLELHRQIAEGAGWGIVLRAFEDALSGDGTFERVEASAAILWAGEETFFHDVIWCDRVEDVAASAPGGPLAAPLSSLLARDPQLREHLIDRGEAVWRHHHGEGAELFLPFGNDEQRCGVLFASGQLGAPVEALSAALSPLVDTFETPAMVLAERRRLRQELAEAIEENRYFRERERRHYLFKDLVCESAAMREVYEQVNARVDDCDPVLMTGEAGTGKELLARALHHLGGRQGGMLIRMNCAEVPRELVDIELFGCVASELIGAVAPREGIFELARDGTVFLDEIDRLSPMMQGKIVRVIQEREVRRIGEGVGRRIETRLIASTHHDLEELRERGVLREDLYQLLKPGVLDVPPLRKRREDILPLARIFLAKFAHRHSAACRSVGPTLAGWMEAYRWPGNVRQLQSFMESAVLMARDDEELDEQVLRVGDQR
ncbi:sigma-54-dependent Fis family transcriptional regulator [Lujinxingia vulgaris]|uniref:Sigma-54-dependent Fis family transcriptional regulator n=1 Tax=Lujinxingia vulgaris TaxID=2600176 RepID=A0A5C6X0I1_9DELT|nr:sigma 54-interacting transcriptional regulator [Lujinxingia vulgaris]TXD35351.1 sigma-54-dependent Fis family transcriptional regulator [Lujinxingia vulgaris]